MEPSSFIIIPLLVALFCLSYIIYRKDKRISHLDAKLLSDDSVILKLSDERNIHVAKISDLGDQLDEANASIEALQARVSELQDIKPNTLNLYRIGDAQTYAYVAAARRRDVLSTIKKDPFLSGWFKHTVTEVTDKIGNVITRKAIESDILTEDSIIQSEKVKIVGDKPFIVSYYA